MLRTVAGLNIFGEDVLALQKYIPPDKIMELTDLPKSTDPKFADFN